MSGTRLDPVGLVLPRMPKVVTQEEIEADQACLLALVSPYRHDVCLPLPESVALYPAIPPSV